MDLTQQIRTVPDFPEIGGAEKLKSMGVEVKSLMAFEEH